ncbi:YeeE/YedE family protein [Aurantimonas aggregata]|uniref:YeeE/YedE family protein n=1 Tax=Aurantimonas aggregata TaxID=2047720 RepID=A0A6L9MM24_9HYPH|nr:YeeE/YedE thiosulfate transporter family protein [Aurantimonas aggregata]NDV88570.1 YeeE/YedE family protein [Aurantimonas aggregata]
MLIESGLALPLAGLVAGVAMGYVARRHHFCTLSALERRWYAGDDNGVRAWGLAILVAIFLTQALVLAGLFDPSQSFYLTPSFGWTGAVLGGLAFGFGMALVGTCGFGALVRLGGGSLGGLVVVIVLGLAALATQRGIIALGRVAIVDSQAVDLTRMGSPDQSLGSLISAVTGREVSAIVTLVVVASLAAWVFRSAAFRNDRGKVTAGIAIGAAVAFGWVATSFIAARSFAPVQIESASFVVPPGDVILQLIAVTGALPDYGAGLVLGVVLGAAAAAVRRHDVRWEACDDARELSRHLAGAVLMGVGGVFALGCTIGQGISAASLLTISAPIALVSIAVGARLGLAFILEGSIRHAFLRIERGPAE